MHTTKLRKVGGSIMMTVPPSVLETLELGAGDTVLLSVDDGKLVATPQRRPKYKLAELLETYDVDGDDPWDDMPPVGDEII